MAAIDVQDLYDEFNFGEQSPYAIKSFLATANTVWKTKPRWVLLVGDATFDPRNYLGTGQVDYLPVELVGTSQLETASDDWFADLNDDGIPAMAVGRLPVSNARTPPRSLVSKILAYDELPAPRRGRTLRCWCPARMTPMTLRGLQSRRLRVCCPRVMTVTKILESSDANPRGDILAALNAGPGLVNFAGHGSTEIWQDDCLPRTLPAPY